MRLKLTRIPALFVVVIASVVVGCSGSSTPKPSNMDAHGDATAPSTDAGSDAGADMSVGTDTGNPGTDAGSAPFVYFVKQANGTTTADLTNGTFTVNSTFGASGNAFKYVAPNYYGTTSNGFIAFPTPLTGDFSITAEVNIVTQIKANNACGIGLGMTTGFSGTDAYGYILMRNVNNSTNGYFVSSATGVSAGAPVVPFVTGTSLALSFTRTGTSLTYGAGPVGGALTTNTAATSLFTNGTTVYGDGAVYPAISFNNVAATITNLVIKDSTGTTVYDSATGALVAYVPASLTLSASTVSVAKSASAIGDGNGGGRWRCCLDGDGGVRRSDHRHRIRHQRRSRLDHHAGRPQGWRHERDGDEHGRHQSRDQHQDDPRRGRRVSGHRHLRFDRGARVSGAGRDDRVHRWRAGAHVRRPSHSQRGRHHQDQQDLRRHPRSTASPSRAKPRPSARRSSTLAHSWPA